MSQPLSPPDRKRLKGNAMFLWQHALRAGRRYLLGAMLAAILAGVASLLQVIWLGRAIDLVLTPESARLVLAQTLLGLLAFAGAKAGLIFMMELNGAKASAALRAHFRHNLYRAIMARGPLGFGQTTGGELTTVLMERVEACDAYVARYLPLLASALVLPGLTFAALVYVVGSGALIVLGGALVLPLLLAIFGIMAGRASRAQFVALTRMGGLFADRLRNLTLLRTFSAAAREQEKLARSTDDFRLRTMRVLRVAFLSAGAMDIVITACFVAMAIHLYHQQTDIIHAVPALLLTLEFFTPLRSLTAAYHDRASALAAVSDIKNWLETPSQLQQGGHRQLPEPISRPSLDLMKVTYTYPGRTDPVLKDYSLHIGGGEFVALTGPSGGGKSTILNLLMGFIVPQQGALALAQQAYAILDPTQRSHAFSYIGQRTRLFHGTLAQNIALGHTHVSRDALLAAAKAAQLEELIAQLPDGLDTPVGDRGYGLSGGQAQRVALARAFLRNAPVLLLDEPTAGLDTDTAQGLLQSIKVLARERTVVMATHDAQALQMADRIIRIGEVQHG